MEGYFINSNGKPSLPRDLVESLMILIHSYRCRYFNLKGLQGNYDTMLPIMIERYAASMDVEGKFSELNVIQKRDGRNVGGRSTQQGALQDVKKLLIVAKHENEMILAKSSTTYVQHSFTKSREDLLKWNTPSTSSKRRRAETNNTYEKNNKQLILDPIAVTGTVSSIRSYHKK